MKRTRRSFSPRALRPIALALSYLLILTTVFVPLVPAVNANSENFRSAPNVQTMHATGLLGAPGRALASLIVFLQGGGLPSVPGSNLPDLDAARQLQAVEPEALPPIASEQACQDCAPCPDCVINHKPSARTGGPYFGSANQPIVFNGLGSFDPDPDDEISDYIWTFGDSSPAVEVHGGTPAHTYASPGQYTVTLKVKDLQGVSSDLASTTATVNAAPTPTPTPSASPTPEQTNAATFISQSVPATMTAGERYPVSVTMRNTGNTTWSAAHLYRLGSQSPQDNNIWGRARVYLPAAVAPGTNVTFSFTVIAPFSGSEETAPANFHWRMVQDGVGFFGDVTQNQSVPISSNYHAPNGDAPQAGSFSNLFMSRIAVQHRTGQPGEDLLSGNYNWGMSLLDLPGRAGLDFNLKLSYNSLAAWTKVEPPYSPLLPPESQQPTSWTFDADGGFPSVGFRLGFPSIQGPFSNVQTGSNAYLLVSPSGSRQELRQIGASNTYEAADSSYNQLIDGGNGGLQLRTTDGSKWTYVLLNREFRCTEIKDRNGNYITIKYEPISGTENPGRVTSIIDTLGRTINFTYDANYRLLTIEQLRTGQPARVWASFGYSDREIDPNFALSPGNAGEAITREGRESVVFGLPERNIISVLTQVGLADGSRYNFDYTSWGQVWRTHHYAADGTELSYHEYNLPQDSSGLETDCPRFTQRLDWVKGFNDDAPLTTSFEINPEGEWGKVTAPDGTSYKEFFSTDYTAWQRGLVTRTETYSADSTTPKKVTTTDWTQDNLAVAYPLNPRATATTISDSDGNRRRTTIEYTTFGLPSDVYEMGPYGTNDWRTLRRTHTDYNLSGRYLDAGVIGLVAGQYLFGPDTPNSSSIQTLLGKTTFEYDVDIGFSAGDLCTSGNEPNAPPGGGCNSPAIQHDPYYGTNFILGRGDLTRATRWDVNHEMGGGVLLTSKLKYNTLGSVVSSGDPAGHLTRISYEDSFSSDGTTNSSVPFVTMAYPTRVTDADGYTSTAKYNYDLGVVTRQQDPKGAAQTTEYDSAGRVKQVTNAVSGAYTRLVYPLSQMIVNKFTTIKDLTTETYTATVFDGAGRVRAVAGEFPNSIGHYSGQFTRYDLMGRAIQQTNPTEMSNQWEAAGDDVVGWHSSSQTYDWKGRQLVTTNPDSTTKKASYGGCGCAGGEVVTLTDEGTQVDIDPGPAVNNVTKKRQQKIYSDPLGRTVKTEVLNWDGPEEFGTGGSVYTTAVNNYNARDQVTVGRQYQGTEASGVYQETVMTYGYGRLKTKHVPEQDAGTATSWNYFADDAIQSRTDARGASATFSYNNRHLVEGVTYSAPAGIPATPSVSYTYDNAGNRISMTDGLGNVSYIYNQLSRLTSETRTFSNIGPSTLNYDYTVGGQLKKITDATNTTINYLFDSIGRLEGVVGSDNLYANVSTYASNFQYRASGAMKAMTDGKGYISSVLYNPKLRPSHFQISGNLVSQDYDYSDDGRISVVRNTSDQTFDRAYSYDQATRLTSARSGATMNGIQYGAIPYHETFGYDSFSNVTARQSQSWNGQTDDSDAASYINNRREGWGYDADGRNTTIDTRTNTFDAAGRQTAMGATAVAHDGSSYTVNQAMTLDGNGAMAKEVSTKSTAPGAPRTTYYLRSSVLGGAIIEEIDSSGQKSAGHVYSPAGQLLATQQPNIPNDMVTWKHSTPAGTTQYTVNTYNSLIGRTEFDPLGADVSLTPPEEPPPGEGDGDIGAGHFGGIMDSRWSDFFNLSSGCMKAGVAASCSQAISFMNGTSGFSSTGRVVGFSMPTWAWEQLGKEPLRRQWAVYTGREFYTPRPPEGWILVPFDPWGDGTAQPIYCKPDVIKAMNQAWGQLGNGRMAIRGTSGGVEAAFNLNGTPINYTIDHSFTNQQNKMTINYNTLFAPNPTFANFHVHPKGRDGNNGMPSTPQNNSENNGKGDTGVFDEIYNRTGQAIQVYVMSRHGLSVYDPVTGRFMQLRKGTEFLKPC